MKYLSLFLFLFVACSTSTNEVEIPNPFESEYKINESKSDLNGTSTYDSFTSTINHISIKTDCEDPKICPTVEIYVEHDFDQNAVLAKDFDIVPGNYTDILLFPYGKCAIPFSAESGILEISRLEDGSFSGNFSVESREINGYQPSSEIGCSENQYSSQAIRTLSFDGAFTSFASDKSESSE